MYPCVFPLVIDRPAALEASGDSAEGIPTPERIGQINDSDDRSAELQIRLLASSQRRRWASLALQIGKAAQCATHVVHRTDFALL
jgi:hypothetical protein